MDKSCKKQIRLEKDIFMFQLQAKNKKMEIRYKNVEIKNVRRHKNSFFVNVNPLNIAIWNV